MDKEQVPFTDIIIGVDSECELIYAFRTALIKYMDPYFSTVTRSITLCLLLRNLYLDREPQRLCFEKALENTLLCYSLA